MGRWGQVGMGAINGTIEVDPDVVRLVTGDGTTELRAVDRPVLRLRPGLLLGQLLRWSEPLRRWDPVYVGWTWRAVRRDLEGSGWTFDVSRRRTPPPRPRRGT